MATKNSNFLRSTQFVVGIHVLVKLTIRFCKVCPTEYQVIVFSESTVGTKPSNEYGHSLMYIS